MEQGNDTMPLSPPSWTWEALGAAESKVDASNAAAAEHGVGSVVPYWAELPSRRWLIEASRSREPDS